MEINIVDKILMEFEKQGILSRIMVVGSWCLYFYKHHFEGSHWLERARTTDIDFDVNSLIKFRNTVDVSQILESLGFLINFHGDGSLSFQKEEKGGQAIHPLVKVEFLVPEIGRPSPEPKKIPGFGITAQPLRWLEILEVDPLTVDYRNMNVKVPQPARFALHKLIVSQRRRQGDKNPKKAKDINQALQVIRLLSELGRLSEITGTVKTLSRKQTKLLRQSLQTSPAEEVTGLDREVLGEVFGFRIKKTDYKRAYS